MTFESDCKLSALQRIQALRSDHDFPLLSDVRAMYFLIKDVLMAFSSSNDGAKSLLDKKVYLVNTAILKASLKTSEAKLSDAQHRAQ